MMKSTRLYTGNASRHLDETTISMGLPGAALMESAGAGAANIIQQCYPNLKECIIFAGKGNNGGDGWVVARHLAAYCIRVIVYHPGKLTDLTPDARLMAEMVVKMAKSKPGFLQILEYPDSFPETTPFRITGAVNTPFPNEVLNRVNPDLQATSIIVDALLGTGLSENVRPDIGRLIKLINKSNLPVVSLDVPSGLDATTGEQYGAAICATHTISLGVLKIGLYLNQGPELSGQRHLINLGFASDCLPERYLLSGSERFQLNQSTRLHKYASGVVYVIGGSSGMIGAAVMAAKAAWKTGCGAVHLMVPGNFVNLAEQLAPELIIISGNNTRARWLDADDITYLLDFIAKRPGTVLLGPGMGRNETTAAFVTEFLSKYNGITVVDADAIHYVSTCRPAGKLILTPHPGEWLSLLGEADHSPWNRLDKSERYAQQSGNIIVSKGYPTYVCTPEAKTWVTGYDTRRFNRAGFGDILSGSIAGNVSMCNDINSSCLKTLIDGKLNFDKACQEGVKFPEPLHLL